MMNSEHSEHHNNLPVSKGTVIACIVLVTVGFLVYTGHTAHLLGFAPYLFILACPLMHVFMHGGHHHHNDKLGEEHSHGGGHGHDGNDKKTEQNTSGKNSDSNLKGDG